jgi:hypothetical protein
MNCQFEGCDRSYCSLFNLKRHIESAHHGMRKFKCPICARFLSSKRNLIDHQNIHTGAKPYKCEIKSCGLRFRQLSQFYLHKQLHEEIFNHIMRSDINLDIDVKMLTRRLGEATNDEDYSRTEQTYTISDVILPEISNYGHWNVTLPQFTLAGSE